MKKNKWFKIEAIPRSNYFMLVPVIKKYGIFIARQGGENYFNDVGWVFEKGIAYLSYRRESFNKGIQFLLDKAVMDPSWVYGANKEIVFHTQKYFNFAKNLEKKDFSKFTKKQLAKAFAELIEYQRKSHISGQMTTWLIDAERQLFSNYLLNLLQQKIKENELKLETSIIFPLLTSPEKPSLLERETGEALEIALLIKKDKKASRVFKSKDVAGIILSIDKLKPEIRRKIINHYKKYLWIHYTYEGPVLELDYFIEIWRGLLREGSLEKLIKESKEKIKNIKTERALLFKKLKFSPKEKFLFNIAKDIVWLKGWRKDCMYFGSYVLDKIAKEIGRRLGLSLNQIRFFCAWEIEDALLKNKFDENELNERAKFSLIISNSRAIKVYSGAKARKVLSKMDFEKEKIKKVDQLTGATASPGKAKGIVKIVETVDDIKKMNKGDILLSETTYPALVPAMKLAGAIVTNVGGLTCHAAIVSRELGIPCVVGTKIATKVFKDGDLVKVDANQGIIKIL